MTTCQLTLRVAGEAGPTPLLIANRDKIDLGLIREQWSVVAEGEDARTAWLEEAIAELVPPET